MDYAVSRRLLTKLDEWVPCFLNEEDIELGSEEAEADQGFKVEEPEQIVISNNQSLNVRWSIYIGDNSEGEPWLKFIKVCCIGPHGNIGSAISHYINRDMIRPDFFYRMDEISKEFSDLSGELFDVSGHLNDCVKRKGNKAWGEELDEGALLVISSLEINNRAMRRLGLGTAMSRLVISVASKISRVMDLESSIHTIVEPGVLVSNSSILQTTTTTLIISFFFLSHLTVKKTDHPDKFLFTTDLGKRARRWK